MSLNKFVKLAAIRIPTVISFFPDEIIIKLEDVSFRIDRMQHLKGFDETVWFQLFIASINILLVIEVCVKAIDVQGY